MKSTGNWILRSVRGASDVIEGKARSIDGIVVIDPHTIEIHLDEPMSFFLSLLTMHESAIIPAEETLDTERFRLRSPGAGPFRIEESVEGQYVRLTRNRDYYIEGEPYLDELRFRLDLRTFREVSDAFLRGEVDIAHGIPLNRVQELRDDPRFAAYMLTTVQLHTSYLGYDTSTAPFNRLEVRKAVNHAIDRQRINDRVFGGLSVIAPGLIPPGLLGYDPTLHGPDHDPERARNLMREAGYGSGFSVDYRTWDSDEFNNSGMVPLIIEDLAAIGIRVNVTSHAVGEARKPLLAPGHGLIFCGNWYADFPDSDNFFFVFFHSESTSVPGINFHRPEIDSKIMEARRSRETDRRTAIYRQLDEMVVDQAPFAPLFHERLFVIHKPDVRGLRMSLVPPPVRYEGVWIEE